MIMNVTWAHSALLCSIWHAGAAQNKQKVRFNKGGGACQMNTMKKEETGSDFNNWSQSLYLVSMKGKMVGILDRKSCWGQRILGTGVLEEQQLLGLSKLTSSVLVSRKEISDGGSAGWTHPQTDHWSERRPEEVPRATAECASCQYHLWLHPRGREDMVAVKGVQPCVSLSGDTSQFCVYNMQCFQFDH